MLSIVRQGTAYAVRYASSDPYGVERQPYVCPDTPTLGRLLQTCGVDLWTQQHVESELQHGRLVVLPLGNLPAWLHIVCPYLAPGSRPTHQVSDI